MEILLANPRGFCAGVDRAIEIVERALESFGAPIYVRHEVVHNKFVVDGLRARGAIFVDELAEVPDGATVIFSAHGVSQAVRAQARTRDLRQQCDLVLVVGSPNSSNSNRLRELAQKQGVPAHLIDGADDIDRTWLEGKVRVGVTAGASAPESLVQGVVARLRVWGGVDARELAGDPEHVTFALPKELRVVVLDCGAYRQ